MPLIELPNETVAGYAFMTDETADALRAALVNHYAANPIDPLAADAFRILGQSHGAHGPLTVFTHGTLDPDLPRGLYHEAASREVLEALVANLEREQGGPVRLEVCNAVTFEAADFPTYFVRLPA